MLQAINTDGGVLIEWNSTDDEKCRKNVNYMTVTMISRTLSIADSNNMTIIVTTSDTRVLMIPNLLSNQEYTVHGVLDSCTTGSTVKKFTTSNTIPSNAHDIIS